jgi:hypothetical protein
MLRRGGNLWDAFLPIQKNLESVSTSLPIIALKTVSKRVALQGSFVLLGK